MLWLPAVRVEVVSIAFPPLTGTVPRIVEPFSNVTVPVGMPLPAVGLTAAVNVTGIPTAEGLFEELNAVTLAFLLAVPATTTVEGDWEALDGTLMVAFPVPTLVGWN
jgi:hypothetical protein